jgi:hypothetical protein
MFAEDSVHVLNDQDCACDSPTNHGCVDLIYNWLWRQAPLHTASSPNAGNIYTNLHNNHNNNPNTNNHNTHNNNNGDVTVGERCTEYARRLYGDASLSNPSTLNTPTIGVAPPASHRLHVPHTVVFSPNRRVEWFFSDARGEVCRRRDEQVTIDGILRHFLPSADDEARFVAAAPAHRDQGAAAVAPADRIV